MNFLASLCCWPCIAPQVRETHWMKPVHEFQRLLEFQMILLLSFEENPICMYKYFCTSIIYITVLCDHCSVVFLLSTAIPGESCSGAGRPDTAHRGPGSLRGSLQRRHAEHQQWGPPGPSGLRPLHPLRPSSAPREQAPPPEAQAPLGVAAAFWPPQGWSNSTELRGLTGGS